VVEAAESFHAGIEGILAGMPERRVPEVMRQGQRLGEVFVEAERPGQGPGDLAHLDRVRQSGAEVVALMVDEDLRLMLQAPERRRVDDPVPVTLELAAGRRHRLGVPSPPAGPRVAGVRGSPSFAKGPHA
jgi:hypothetical protein